MFRVWYVVTILLGLSLEETELRSFEWLRNELCFDGCNRKRPEHVMEVAGTKGAQLFHTCVSLTRPISHPMQGNSYKDEKEAFVSGMTGSTVSHINLLSSVVLVRKPTSTITQADTDRYRHPYFSCIVLKPGPDYLR